MGQWIDWAGGAVGAASEESEKAWRRRHAADGEARVAEGAHGIGTPGLGRRDDIMYGRWSLLAVVIRRRSEPLCSSSF